MKYCNCSGLLRITKVFGFSVVEAKSVMNAGIICSWFALTNELAPTVTPQPVIKSAEEMTSFMLNPGMQFAIVVVMSLIFNFLLGLIVSAVVKREKPIFE